MTATGPVALILLPEHFFPLRIHETDWHPYDLAVLQDFVIVIVDCRHVDRACRFLSMFNRLSLAYGFHRFPGSTVPNRATE